MVRTDQKSSDGEHNISINAAHFPLIRDVISTFGPVMKVSLSMVIKRRCPWLAVDLVTPLISLDMEWLVMGLREYVHAIA
jgi:hypothetical protein